MCTTVTRIEERTHLNTVHKAQTSQTVRQAFNVNVSAQGTKEWALVFKNISDNCGPSEAQTGGGTVPCHIRKAFIVPGVARLLDIVT